MPTLREIRNRIDGVAKTQKITRAMKMVATARFSRATRAIAAARPYAVKLREVLGSVASGADADSHPLLAVRPVRKVDLVVVTSDRGLCGAYNANIIKVAEREIVSRRPSLESMSILCVGRKGSEYFRRKKGYPEVVETWQGLGSVTPEQAREVARVLSERYEKGEADEVKLVYSEFVSALSQKPGIETLLPLRLEQTEAAPLVYEVEPDAESLLALLVPRAVEFAVFRAMLENQAGEHGARMTAMESATNNTQQLITSLTLVANKVRQSKITAELVEIVSGAESL